MWLTKQIREASDCIRLGRNLLEEAMGTDIVALQTIRFIDEEPELEQQGQEPGKRGHVPTDTDGHRRRLAFAPPLLAFHSLPSVSYTRA